MSKIHIIGEAGTNHNGSIDKAKKLIDIAVESKLDSVKFQVINPWGLYLPGEYSYGHYDIKEVIRIREQGVMTDDEYTELNAYAKNQGIPFTASVFDTAGLDLLCGFDPPYIKIASSDLNNTRFLKEVAERKIKMIVSTGMSTLKDIEKSLKAIGSTGMDDIVLLHCVSVYPCALEQTNLQFITKLKSEFGFTVGFSDHTGDSVAASMALSLGATWFEKHFTEDRSQEGFDHPYAMEPAGMKAYSETLRKAEAAYAVAEDKISSDERYTRNRARRSLYSSRAMKAGEIIKSTDILIVRPEGPMNADEYDLLIGKPLLTDLPIHTAFTKELIEG